MNTPRRTIVFFVLALLVFSVSILGYAFGYRYVSQLSKEVDVLKTQAAKLFSRRISLAARRDDLLVVSSVRSQIESYRVNRKTVVSLIESLEYIAQVSGVSFRVSLAETKTEDAGSLFLTWSALGSDQNVLRFLSLVELLPYDLSFERVIMTRQDREDSSLDVVIRVNRYEDK